MKLIANLASMLAASTALAQQLPTFDIEKHCANAGGIREYCIQRTQGIYNQLQREWESIPGPVKAKCLSLMKKSPRSDSYYWLQDCVRYETAPPPPAYPPPAYPPPGYGYPPPPYRYYYSPPPYSPPPYGY